MAQERTAFDFERLAGGSERDLRFTKRRFVYRNSSGSRCAHGFPPFSGRSVVPVDSSSFTVQSSKFAVRNPSLITLHSKMTFLYRIRPDLLKTRCLRHPRATLSTAPGGARIGVSGHSNRFCFGRGRVAAAVGAAIVFGGECLGLACEGETAECDGRQDNCPDNDDLYINKVSRSRATYRNGRLGMPRNTPGRSCIRP